MAYFPMFVDLDGKRILIVGGGKVALRKVEKLLPYGPGITVAAPELCDELSEMPGIGILKQAFRDELIRDADIVIAATDDRELNRHISGLCRASKIPVNTVDDSELCSFIFPCLIKNGDLSIGISTGGASPTAAISFKEMIEACIPDNTGEILDFLGSIRPTVKAKFPSEKQRSRIFKELFECCRTLGRPLTEAETREYLDNVR